MNQDKLNELESRVRQLEEQVQELVRRLETIR